MVPDAIATPAYGRTVAGRYINPAANGIRSPSKSVPNHPPCQYSNAESVNRGDLSSCSFESPKKPIRSQRKNRSADSQPAVPQDIYPWMTETRQKKAPKSRQPKNPREAKAGKAVGKNGHSEPPKAQTIGAEVARSTHSVNIETATENKDKPMLSSLCRPSSNQEESGKRELNSWGSRILSALLLLRPFLPSELGPLVSLLISFNP